VSSVKIPSSAGSAASFQAYMETEPPGTKPMPPVRRALTAPRILKKLYFLLLTKSETPYPIGKSTAMTRRMEATTELLLGTLASSPIDSPNQSSPLRRIKIGSKRLKMKFTQRFSLRFDLVD